MNFVKVGLICPGIVNSEIGGASITIGMDTDKFTGIATAQIKEGKFYIVSHAYNIVRINERQTEIKEAYQTYAPRYEGVAYGAGGMGGVPPFPSLRHTPGMKPAEQGFIGDIEFDVRTIYARMTERQ